MVPRGSADSDLACLGSASVNTPSRRGIHMTWSTRHIQVHVLESTSRVILTESIGPRSELHAIVPNVINPTSALGGSIPMAAAKAPRRAFKSSSSKHVSTTKRKIGGTGTGRASVYSMVVYLGSSSAGRLVLEISL